MAGCEVNQIFLGEVASVQNYGAFVRIPGCSQQGLIHKSQVSTTHVDNVTEVLQKGERVWCKVISIRDDGKIGLSMKYVNQGKGTDLDPNNVELTRDMQKQAKGRSTVRSSIHLEAILNTTCTKCGTHGHLASDCFMSPDGKKYELIPEIEEESVAIPEVEVKEREVEKEKEKKHKQKKAKKRKKSKKSKQNSDDSESDEKETVKKKKKKYSKDQKKKKKRKYDSSSSDENSSDNSLGHNMKSHKRKHSDSLESRTKKCKYSKNKHPDQ